MIYGLAADFLVLLHFLFILFVALGGILVIRHRRLIWLHVPAAVWGATVEFTGWICPLTPWEQALRAEAGESGYPGGFIEHYLTAWIYPAGLTPAMQMVLGSLVFLLNGGIYGWIWARSRFAASRSPSR